MNEKISFVFKKELTDLLKIHVIDTVMNSSCAVLSSYICNCLNELSYREKGEKIMVKPYETEWANIPSVEISSTRKEELNLIVLLMKLTTIKKLKWDIHVPNDLHVYSFICSVHTHRLNLIKCTDGSIVLKIRDSARYLIYKITNTNTLNDLLSAVQGQFFDIDKVSLTLSDMLKDPSDIFSKPLDTLSTNTYKANKQIVDQYLKMRISKCTLLPKETEVLYEFIMWVEKGK